MSARLYALSSSVAACRYNPKLQQQLEEHVAEQVRWTAMASAAAAAGLRRSVCSSNAPPGQVKSGTYDLDANLALLRHYNFAPEGAKMGVVAHILIKALMRLPEPDFSQLLHLVPERVQVLSRVSRVSPLPASHAHSVAALAFTGTRLPGDARPSCCICTRCW